MLTGRTRFRESIFHKIVLEVEVIEPAHDHLGYEIPFETWTFWRDAKKEDLKEIITLLDRNSILEGAARIAETVPIETIATNIRSRKGMKVDEFN